MDWPLAKPNPTVCILACRCVSIKSLFLLSPAQILNGRAQLYSFKLANEALYFSTIYPNSCESFSVQPCLPLAATIGHQVLSPARILDGRPQIYSSELSYSAVVINNLTCIFLNTPPPPSPPPPLKLLESLLTVRLSNISKGGGPPENRTFQQFWRGAGGAITF